jgi:hypothetical protein
MLECDIFDAEIYFLNYVQVFALAPFAHRHNITTLASSDLKARPV